MEHKLICTNPGNLRHAVPTARSEKSCLGKLTCLDLEPHWGPEIARNPAALGQNRIAPPVASSLGRPVRGFVLALRGQLSRLCAIGQHGPYLTSARARRFENQMTAVGRPTRTLV